MTDKATRGEVIPAVKGRILSAQITIERDEPSGWPSGDRFIWARFAGEPSMDALLVTIHYRYGFQDNGTIQGIAERVAAALTEARAPAAQWEGFPRAGGSSETI